MIVGVNRATIQRNVLHDLYNLLGFPPPSSKTNESRIYGRNIYFIGAHDEGAVRGIQGATLALAYVDEATCIPEPFWRMLGSRLSVDNAQLFATCNPEGPSHWLKKTVIDRTDLNVIYWNFLLDDNPALGDAYKDNLKKEYQGGHWYRRFILGEWAASSGAVYDGFDEDNLFEKQMVQPNYYIAAIDYGTINSTCCLIGAVTPKLWPQIRVEEEYYWDSQKTGRTKSDVELAQDIKRFISHRRLSALYVDPSSASLKIELRNLDLPVIDAKNDVLLGIQIVNKFVYGKNLVIHRSCKNLVEQMTSYQWDPKSIKLGEDRPLKNNDHAVDALRYMTASAFPTGQFSQNDDNITMEQLRRQVYGDDGLDFHSIGSFGYV